MSTDQASPEKYGFQNHLVAVVYELLSPAILGAMTFEMLSRPTEVRSLFSLSEHARWREPQFQSQICILALFCLSWGYLRYLKRKGQESNSEEGRLSPFWKGVILPIDFLSLFGFQLAFAFTGDPAKPPVTLMAIGGIALGYVVIQLIRRIKLHRKEATVGAVAAGGAAAVLFGIGCLPQFSKDWEPIVLAVVVGFYVLFLILLYVHSPETPSRADSTSNPSRTTAHRP